VAPVELAMFGHNKLGEQFVATEHDVAAALSLDLEANSGERGDALAPAQAWQFGHTATRSVSR
jgi:hypothetical protein